MPKENPPHHHDKLPPLREVIANHNLSARKQLGQNFLLDLNLTGRIARACGDLSGKTVIEIGPGPGGLTRALLSERAAMVIAIERDRRCLAALQDLASHYGDRLRLIEDDALALDYANLFKDLTNVQIAANLPYNISTELLTRFLQIEPWPPWFERMTLMFQREVAERITAEPSTKAYGRLSVLTQWRCQTKRLFSIPPQAFTPPPKVHSALVSFIPRTDLTPPCNVKILQKVTAAAFGQRRKMIKSSLKSILDHPAVILEDLNIDPNARAETLSVDQFCRIAQKVEDQLSN